jgi:glycosyltransferase involved in cell wall biosynthesis
MEKFHPFVSVIVPTYDRAQQLSRCLSALSRQDYPIDCFEVIVVNDGGTTSLKGEVDGFLNRLNVTLVVQRHSGPAAARNTGAKRARGMLLAFTDDDCIPKPDWIRKLAARFAETQNCIIGGRTRNGLHGNAYATASQVIIDLVYSPL